MRCEKSPKEKINCLSVVSNFQFTFSACAKSKEKARKKIRLQTTRKEEKIEKKRRAERRRAQKKAEQRQRRVEENVVQKGRRSRSRVFKSQAAEAV